MLALPTVLLGVVCAEVARRNLVALVGALVVATFVVQTQLATVPIALAMILAGVILAAMHRRGASRPTISPVGTAAAGLLCLLLVAFWFPPILDQILHIGHSSRPVVSSALHPGLPQVDPSQGNFVSIWRFLETLHGGHSLSSVFSWLVPDPVLFVVLLGAIVVAIVWGRRVGKGLGADLGVVTIVAGLATIYALTRVVGPIQIFDVTWDGAIAVLAAIAGGVSVFGRLPLVRSDTSPRPPVAAPVGAARILSGAGVVALVAAAGAMSGTLLERVATYQVSSLSAPSMAAAWPIVEAQLRHDTSVFVLPVNRGAYGVAAGITDELVARGVRVTVPVTWSPEFGAARDATGDEQVAVLVAVGPYGGKLPLQVVTADPRVRLLVVSRRASVAAAQAASLGDPVQEGAGRGTHLGQRVAALVRDPQLSPVGEER